MTSLSPQPARQTGAELIAESWRVPDVLAAIFDRHARTLYRYLGRPRTRGDRHGAGDPRWNRPVAPAPGPRPPPYRAAGRAPFPAVLAGGRRYYVLAPAIAVAAVAAVVSGAALTGKIPGGTSAASLSGS